MRRSFGKVHAIHASLNIMAHKSSRECIKSYKCTKKCVAVS